MNLMTLDVYDRNDRMSNSKKKKDKNEIKANRIYNKGGIYQVHLVSQ